MATKKQKHLIYSLAAAAVLVAGSASAYYVAQGRDTATTQATATPASQQAAVQPQAVQQQPACDDGNIVGVGVGAVAGGLLGNQIGKGDGKTLATAGGALGGGVIGQKYIPTHNVTCPK